LKSSVKLLKLKIIVLLLDVSIYFPLEVIWKDAKIHSLFNGGGGHVLDRMLFS